MNIISKIILPIVILFIIFYGVKKHINVFETFLEGAKEGLKIVFNIFPSILAMVFAINIFLDSNFINVIGKIFLPILHKLQIPIDIIPMALLRPISGTASLSVMNNIFFKFGPDSFVGRLASVLQGCTDTTIYVIALYFSSVGIKKIKYSLSVGLFADIIGIIVAFLVTILFFN